MQTKTKRDVGLSRAIWQSSAVVLVLALAALATCSGCVSMVLEDTAPIARPADCQGPKDCEAKWAAARRWVLDHAAFKIQTYAADYIQTYGPLPHDTSIAVEVSREPLDGDRYQIVARIVCGNSFGCVPGVHEALDDFNRTVAAAGSEGGAT